MKLYPTFDQWDVHIGISRSKLFTEQVHAMLPYIVWYKV
jgi:hypothetical protein